MCDREGKKIRMGKMKFDMKLVKITILREEIEEKNRETEEWVTQAEGR